MYVYTYMCVHIHIYIPLRQKRQVGFVSNYVWKNLAAVFFTHLARTLRMFCEIMNHTHVANSHTAFGQFFQENAFSYRKC